MILFIRCFAIDFDRFDAGASSPQTTHKTVCWDYAADQVRRTNRAVCGNVYFANDRFVDTQTVLCRGGRRVACVASYDLRLLGGFCFVLHNPAGLFLIRVVLRMHTQHDGVVCQRANGAVRSCFDRSRRVYAPAASRPGPRLSQARYRIPSTPHAHASFLFCHVDRCWVSSVNQTTARNR